MTVLTWIVKHKQPLALVLLVIAIGWQLYRLFTIG